MPASNLRYYHFLLLTFCCGLVACYSSENALNKNWAFYGGDAGQTRYSPLSQITPQNVADLEIAWEYHSGDADSLNRTQIQCNPLIIDGILYGSSPSLSFFALDAQTGLEKWRYNPFAEDYNMFGMGVNRGLVYWEEGAEKRILFTASHYLYALDAETGKPIPSFGVQGKVDLKKGLGEEAQEKFVVSNTPGAIYEDILVLGTRVDEGAGAAPGDVRAYDVRSGDILWTFHTIPHPGEFGHDTWPEDAWSRVGGANSWAGISIDQERGWAFIPTGSASYDFYGGDRWGDNLFANCILALDARTGERIWHFQTVHHDLWDRDVPAAPNLIRVRHQGKMKDAISQITKDGFVYVLDRETGEPLFPVEEREVPPSVLEGEQAAATQPFPSLPKPFARQHFSEAEITDIGEENQAYVRNIWEKTRHEGLFVPPSPEGTIILPGFDGGGEWGGAAIDPATRTLYVNASEMPWILTMVPAQKPSEAGRGKVLYQQYCSSCHGQNREGGEFMGTIPALTDIAERKTASEISLLIRQGKGAMPAFSFLDSVLIADIIEFLDDPEVEQTAGKGGDDLWHRPYLPYVSTGYHRFYDQEGYPAIRPPWGTLTAIDLNTGQHKWQVRLGEYQELTAKGIPLTGTENYGGPVVTEGGLVFIAATRDERFRAFDKQTGLMLWETDLPAGGYATPAIYMIDGKQFVVIACGGGKMGTPSGDTYRAYHLPD